MRAYFLHYDWHYNSEYLDMQCEENTCTSETGVGTRDTDPLISPDANASANRLCSTCVLDESNRQAWLPSDCIQPKRTNNTKYCTKSSFFILFNIPFKIYFTHRNEPMGRRGETKVPRENYLTHPQAEVLDTALSSRSIQ